MNTLSGEPEKVRELLMALESLTKTELDHLIDAWTAERSVAQANLESIDECLAVVRELKATASD